MAKRKKVSQPFQLDLSPMMSLMSQKFQLDKMTQQQALIAEREAARQKLAIDAQGQKENQDFANQVKLEALKDPTLAARASGQGYGVEAPDPGMLTNKLVGEIGSAKTPDEVPTQEGAIAKRRAMDNNRGIGGEEALQILQAVPNRRTQLAANELEANSRKPIDLEFMDDAGTKQKVFTTRGAATGPFPQERTGPQEAIREGQKAGATAKATRDVNMSPEAINQDVNKAGKMASASREPILEAAARAEAVREPVSVSGERAGAVAQAQEKFKAPNPAESKAAASYLRLAASHENAKKLETKDMSYARASYGPEFIKPQQAKAYNEAKKEFLNGLRSETGANLPEAEMALVTDTYFGLPNDGPDVITAKQEARKRLLQGQVLQVGPNLRVKLDMTGALGQPTTPALGSAVDKLLQR